MSDFSDSEEEDLTLWISKNRMRFLFNKKHYTPDYVAWLAYINGFNPSIVFRRLADFQYALSLTSAENAYAKKANLTIKELVHYDQKIRLDDSWEALGRKLLFGKDFDE